MKMNRQALVDGRVGEEIRVADNERLVIRHDAGSSAAPYVAGTLLAIRRVAEKPGLRRGLDTLMA